MGQAEQRQSARNLAIMLMDSLEVRRKHRDHEDNNPRTVCELAHCDGAHGDDSRRRACAIDGCLQQPTLSACLPPVHHHSGQAQRKGEEHAHGEQRDQAVRAPPKATISRPLATARAMMPLE